MREILLEQALLQVEKVVLPLKEIKFLIGELTRKLLLGNQKILS